MNPQALKIMYVASEVAPFAKVGGLGDVSGALPKALKKLDHDVRVVMPLYQQVSREGLQRLYAPLGVRLGHEHWCAVWVGQIPDSEVPVYFIEYEDYFGRPGVYSDHGDGAQRYALLSQAALQLCRYLNWTPDVIHCNDWQTSLLPAYLNSHERGSRLGQCGTLLTIHNLAYQGMFDPRVIPEVRLPWGYFNNGDYQTDRALNLLKGGLFHSTLISTVSPTYAREIQQQTLGMKLDWVLRERGASLFGVLNGIDEEVWNPETDKYLPANFTRDDMSGKWACKQHLQAEMGLPVRDVPLVSFIGRLVAQKGIDIIIKALPQLLQHDLQFVLLGSGDPHSERQFRKLEAAFPGRFSAAITYNEGLAHRIEAGSDLFLMPSRFEPCGLNQMYSMRYGTLPIVRATGGLEDTVINHHVGVEQGTGFKFWQLTTPALINSVLWAVETVRHEPDVTKRMRHRAMSQDFSWRRAALRYESLYQLAIARRRGL